jgi:DNA-binding transcriptional ArsR family regulator
MADAPPDARTPEEVQRIAAPGQLGALAHPLRQRLLFALGHEPATISQLAARLTVNKGNVAYHVKVLREAELVHVARTRQVRGGTEQYYQRTARRLIIDDPGPAGTAALLGAVAQELDRSPAEPLLTVRHLRLTPASARRLADALSRLVDEAEEDPAQPVHGVLVSLYRHPEEP